MYDNNHGFYKTYRSKVEIKNRGKYEEEVVIWYVGGGGAGNWGMQLHYRLRVARTRANVKLLTAVNKLKT